MSQTDVELAKRALEAFNRRDVEQLVAMITPDMEWFPAMGGAVKDGYHGREGVETYLSEVRDTWKDYRIRSSEFRELEHGVLVLGRAEGSGLQAGVTVDSPLGMVIDVVEGRISRARSFLDHDEAAHAARSLRQEVRARASARLHRAHLR